MPIMTDKGDQAKGPSPVDSGAAQAEPAGDQAVPSGAATGQDVSPLQQILRMAVEGLENTSAQASLCAIHIGAAEHRLKWLRDEVRHEAGIWIRSLTALVDKLEAK